VILLLEKLDTNRTIETKEYNAAMKRLQRELAALQLKVKELEIPILIVFEGWSAAGKGTAISRLVYSLDPRDFNVYTMGKVAPSCSNRPFLCAYAANAPSKGRMAIYDKSWHRISLPEGQKAWKLKPAEKKGFYHDVNAFEKQLADDGTLIIKFFLHISKDEQKRRFDELEKNEATKWRIVERDKIQNKNYGKYTKYFDRMLTQTNECPWHIVAADDSKFAALMIYETLIAEINAAITSTTSPDKQIEMARPTETTQNSILKNVDLDKTISNEEYNKKLQFLQSKLSNLCYKMYAKRTSVVIVYEGWDAAGKGGNIKRLTQELDPRGYEVVPISAPTDEELRHQYLWRFWNKLPKDGHLTIFDRSWYGRVLVERVEGFATESEWRRAYQEINDMELHLANHGVVIFKFWVHIDKSEQLARFESRKVNEWKQHKLTDDDWRNRDKWGDYEAAVNEMINKTNTAHAPWVIIESNNKKYARIKTLEIVTEQLERMLS